MRVTVSGVRFKEESDVVDSAWLDVAQCGAARLKGWSRASCRVGRLKPRSAAQQVPRNILSKRDGADGGRACEGIR